MQIKINNFNKNIDPKHLSQLSTFKAKKKKKKIQNLTKQNKTRKVK